MLTLEVYFFLKQILDKWSQVLFGLMNSVNFLLCNPFQFVFALSRLETYPPIQVGRIEITPLTLQPFTETWIVK